MDIPKFTTTPGSQFSFLCGLIYEIATGKADESLAGAINRFSSSEDKKRMDMDELENKTENDNYESGDNFAEVKNEARRLLKEADLWKRISSSRDWSTEESRLIYLRLKAIVERIEECLNRVGPFLVWAHQPSSVDTSEIWGAVHRRERDLLAREITLGRTRRRARQGIEPKSPDH
jgi:hypothetical protein